jgi:aspartate racemase
MKRLGIIGGIAPPSTIDYYRQLTTRYRALSPDGNYPSIILDSIDAAQFFPMLASGDRAAMIEFLLIELGRLARAGADMGIFASNTPHMVFDEVAARSPIPLISIVEETAIVAQAAGYRRLGLLGARFTMEGGFYEAVFARHDMTVVVPEADDRDWVHDAYFSELIEGAFRNETRGGMIAVMDRMNARERIDGVILGGTELPLLFRDGAPSTLPLLDTTTIHVESAVARLLS